jgi:hypothetical protein
MIVALALTCGPAHAADAPSLADAKAMIEQTYRAYCNRCEVDFDRTAKRLFSPRLWGLVLRDRRLTPAGDVGALDGDPICDCQDYAITGVVVQVTAAAAPDRATAIAKFRNFGEPTTVTLDLVVLKGRWRIDNIHAKGTPDLARFLQVHGGGR